MPAVKVALRIAFVLGGLAVAGLVLYRAFDGLEAGEVADALGGLTLSDCVALAGVFVVLPPVNTSTRRPPACCSIA